MGIVSFTQLDVWQKGHELVLAVYRVTESFPSREQFRLTHQLCKAAISITCNIAEGFGRRQPKDKMRFYNISEGSVQEVRSCLILSRDLKYLPEPEPLFKLATDVESMLRKLIASVERNA